MPVPWEALIPFGLLTGMYAVTGTLFNVVKRAENDGKPPRYNLEAWDDMMMERDRRLTGSKRGQTSDPVAPESFATNSVWATKDT
ncbi:small secreted protein [Clavulina sp. PMI_390]|nr:small secreted protein [Clavulina sp. PMI_390]